METAFSHSKLLTRFIFPAGDEYFDGENWRRDGFPWMFPKRIGMRLRHGGPWAWPGCSGGKAHFPVNNRSKMRN